MANVQVLVNVASPNCEGLPSAKRTQRSTRRSSFASLDVGAGTGAAGFAGAAVVEGAVVAAREPGSGVSAAVGVVAANVRGPVAAGVAFNRAWRSSNETAFPASHPARHTA